METKEKRERERRSRDSKRSRGLKQQTQRRMARTNFHSSSRRHCPIFGNPLNVAVHDPGTAADVLNVDDAFPVAASGVLDVVDLRNKCGEDGGAQLEGTLEGRVQVDARGRVGGVRFELEHRVGGLFRKVERERRVGRARVDEEGAVRFVLARGDQGEVGDEGAVTGAHPYFGWDGVVLVERVDYDLDGGVGRLDVE
jgi:hypothetical protein